MINVDHNQLFPNQLIDNDETECAGICISDIAGNIDHTQYSYDFTYASAFRLLGLPPSTGGTDPWAAAQSAVFYGLLPAQDATINSKTVGELMAANWQAYTPAEIQEALTHAKSGVKQIDLSIPAITAYIKETGWGVAITGDWFQSWTFATPASGLLTAPTGTPLSHDYACYGVDDMGDLLIKPWLGPEWGDKGYGYLDEVTFSRTARFACAFDPNANRWVSILGMLVTRFPQLATLLPDLLNAHA